SWTGAAAHVVHGSSGKPQGRRRGPRLAIQLIVTLATRWVAVGQVPQPRQRKRWYFPVVFTVKPRLSRSADPHVGHTVSWVSEYSPQLGWALIHGFSFSYSSSRRRTSWTLYFFIFAQAFGSPAMHVIHSSWPSCFTLPVSPSCSDT